MLIAMESRVNIAYIPMQQSRRRRRTHYTLMTLLVAQPKLVLVLDWISDNSQIGVIWVFTMSYGIL